MRIALGTLLALAVAALTGFQRAAASTALNGRIIESTYESAAGELSYDVYLPPGYDSSSLRYPVVYYLHGLPAGARSFTRFGYVASALEASGLPAIVVAPQGATAADTDPEYLDQGPGQDWETAIGVQLPHIVDATYRTIPTRLGRAIIGVSAGGYGAMLIGLHHLALYSAIESWSGYFHPTDPTGERSISSRAWLSAHAFVPSLRKALAVHPTFFGFYVGEQDQLFRPENIQLARELSRAKVPFLFRIYPGGHTQALWTAQAPRWLTVLLGHLAAPFPASG